jgi:RNase P/RNase MRP subunit p29
MEEPQTPFKFFIGKLCRIVFRDGNVVLAKVGQVISETNGLLEFQTHHHRYLVRTDQILKIQEA